MHSSLFKIKSTLVALHRYERIEILDIYFLKNDIRYILFYFLFLLPKKKR